MDWLAGSMPARRQATSQARCWAGPITTCSSTQAMRTWSISSLKLVLTAAGLQLRVHRICLQAQNATAAAGDGLPCELPGERATAGNGRQAGRRAGGQARGQAGSGRKAGRQAAYQLANPPQLVAHLCEVLFTLRLEAGAVVCLRDGSATRVIMVQLGITIKVGGEGALLCAQLWVDDPALLRNFGWHLHVG